MCTDQSVANDVETCVRVVICELREQHELAKRLDDGPLRRVTLNLLESSLYAYRFVSTRRRRPTRKAPIEE